jgi:hypothetical protein
MIPDWDAGKSLHVGVSELWKQPTIDEIYQVSSQASPDRAGTLVLPWLPGLPVGDCVWHYTDSTALLSIIEEGVMRASSVAILNDSAEIKYGLHRLDKVASPYLAENSGIAKAQRQFFERVRTAVDEYMLNQRIYVLCASTEPDGLSQWRGMEG